MRSYLLIVLLLVVASSYRYIRDRPITLSALPDEIFYLQSDLLVTKTGRNINIINTTNDQSIQNFTADSDNPDIQISPETHKVLFRNNQSIFQLQQAKQPYQLQVSTQEINWVYRFGSSGNYTIMHTMSNTNGGRNIYYIDIYDESQYKSWSQKLSGENVVAGSGVQAISPQEYYFVSGGLCGVEGEDDIFIMYEGSSDGIENVFNFSVNGCNYPLEEGHKEEWYLRTIDIGNNDRWHAFTYVLDTQNKPRWYTTQVVAKYNGVPSEVLRFDTSRLIGQQFLNMKLYTADDELCRILEHNFANYLNTTETESYLPADVSSTMVSPDEEWIVGLTGTSRSYLLNRLNDTYILAQTVNSPGDVPIIEAYFVNETKVIFKDNFTNLYIYDVPNERYIKSSVGTVDDYCVTDNSLVFTFTKETNDDYILHALRVEKVGNDLEFVELGTRVLDYPSSDLLCIGNEQVLVNALNFGEPIRIWKYNSTFTNIASLIKLPTLHDIVYKTKNYIYFTNTDKRTTPLFYSFTLAPISISNFIMMAPDTVYHFLKTWDDNLVLAVGDDLNNLSALDYYYLDGKVLKYGGTYPLLSNGTADVDRIVVLGSSEKVHIDYSGYESRMVSYYLSAPPQKMQGLFYDQTELDCSGYSNALFRINNVTNKTQMIVINGLEDTPVLQRFQFGDMSATLVNTAYVENYIYTKLAIELSANKQNVLVYGIKRTTTLVDCIQIRSSTNLGDITFEKIYFDQLDPSDIQAFTLVQNNVFAAVISTNDNFTEDHYVKLLSEPNSGGKVSTGQIGNVYIYASCLRCNFVAVVGDLDRSRVYLTAVDSGVRQRTIEAGCQVELISLNIDGTLVGYMCTDKRLMVFNTQTELKFEYQNSYPTATQIKILSYTDLILTVDGGIVHIDIKVAAKRDTKDGKSGDSIMKKIVDLGYKIVQSRMLSDANADAQAVVDYDAQTYAIVDSTQTSIQFSRFSGQLIDVFPLRSDERVVSIAFAPNNQLTVLTNKSDLIMISPDACPRNQSQIEGYCICDPSFDNSVGQCACSPEHYYQQEQCFCEDGKYFYSVSHCADCSSFCSTCSTGDGIGDCDSYGAVFFIMIAGIILVVLVIAIIVVLWVLKRKQAKQWKKSSELGEERLVEDERD